jgi:outer membrane protein OmpA-like peptidoglycan-associated protein
MSRLNRFLSLGVVLCGLLAPLPARAEFPDWPTPYIGITGGINGATRNWDLGSGVNGYPGKGVSGLVGMRLGIHFHPQFMFEGQLAYIPLSDAGDTNSLLSWDFSLLVGLLKYNWTPTLNAGLGGYSLVSGKLGKDTDPRGHVGVGVRGLVLDWLAVRSDLRVVFSDGFDTPGALNLEWTLGVDFYPWRAAPAAPPPPPPPADRDKDGIVDSEDACPDEPGPKETSGCPDKDGDKIIDKEDACPDQAGPAATKGCPDKDGDGILDKEDRCPDKAGPKELKGCPDTDGDGLADIDDRCPKEAGPKELKGCPDKDGDKVPDIDDKCPDVPGLIDHQGCLPDVVKKFTGSIKGITFATGSAKILAASNKVLDQAITVLKEYPTVRLRIEGHTDNVGKPEKNQKLSQARAESVKAYMEKKGIEADRLEAVGYGDTKPVGDNKTKAGKAQNRRIEFTPLAAAPAAAPAPTPAP